MINEPIIQLTMAGKLTFTMIKPDAISAGNMGNIIKAILEGGFEIKALKLLKFNKIDAEKFYYIHHEKTFYNGLCEFMSSGPICAAILEKDNAVEAYRAFIGSTNPADAKEGSIRRLYGTSIQWNAVHGSDSDENAMIEASFFFNHFEIL